ncbi:MAG: hypothetical protein VX015_11925 [Planctomycetota bacterium]|nr:hypothetical protein [Planctomycetota bacterium]MEC8512847.1 hypothetical protein [Planctomycetota bacterium]
MKTALRFAAIALGLAAWAVLPGCMITTTQDPPGIERAVLTPVPAVRAWVVMEEGRVEGSVVRYAERGQGGRFLYVVRNVWDQDVGVVDELGRAWRRVPHQEDRWLSTGTVADGVRRILDLGRGCALSEQPIEAVELATRGARAR